MIDANLGQRPVIAIPCDPSLLATFTARYRLALLDPSGAQEVFRVDGPLVGSVR